MLAILTFSSYIILYFCNIIDYYLLTLLFIISTSVLIIIGIINMVSLYYCFNIKNNNDNINKFVKNIDEINETTNLLSHYVETNDNTNKLTHNVETNDDTNNINIHINTIAENIYYVSNNSPITETYLNGKKTNDFKKTKNIIFIKMIMFMIKIINSNTLKNLINNFK